MLASATSRDAAKTLVAPRREFDLDSRGRSSIFDNVASNEGRLKATARREVNLMATKKKAAKKATKKTAKKKAAKK